MNKHLDQQKISTAHLIARLAHKGQVDKAGEDYINHPLTVASMCYSTDTIVCALLHDVMEDTDVTRDELLAVFGEKIVEALDCLTHRDNEDYFDYVRRAKSNPISRCVKIEDLYHNANLDRLDNPTEQDYQRREKYFKAIRILTDGFFEDKEENPELMMHIRSGFDTEPVGTIYPKGTKIIHQPDGSIKLVPPNDPEYKKYKK